MAAQCAFDRWKARQVLNEICAYVYTSSIYIYIYAMPLRLHAVGKNLPGSYRPASDNKHHSNNSHKLLLAMMARIHTNPTREEKETYFIQQNMKRYSSSSDYACYERSKYDKDPK